MKYPMIKTASAITTLLICFFASTSSAQRLNTWRGGTPGHETDWNYFKNWSLGKTPDAFDRVLIPDVSSTTRMYPVISNTGVEISSLEIQPGATITILPNAWIQTDAFESAGICNGCNKRLKVYDESGKGNGVAAAH